MSDQDLEQQKAPAGDGIQPAEESDEVKPTSAAEVPADDPLSMANPSTAS